MIPYSDFKFSNATLGPPPGMDDCLPLRIHRTADCTRCISCWRPTWRERLSILFFGRVWIDIYSGHTQPPVALTGRRRYLVVRKEAEAEL